MSVCSWLPMLAVSAAGLWRGRALPHLLVGGVLTMLVVESVGIAVDQWFGATADPGTEWASTSMVAPMLILAAVGVGAAVLLLSAPRP
ncbi:MAG: hypothetical protein ACXW2D_15435 [Burkholderiaceae bacterium]